MISSTGMVPKQARQVAKDREDVGKEQHHGGVRPLRRNGAARAATSGLHREER
ncbi:hypothetical protein DPMN_096092 [Dreissena polymorpha]|uniref:Uncharacterized protein n=1 Tax=Dreissena polymorpha TaxID=45954 RepID=A0A9D4L995_DREPO|nr:hypothetical protein DPMN_096092 [Dreissena polymorpha]